MEPIKKDGVMFEKLSARGRRVKARKLFAKGSGDPVHDERKRIFMEHMRFLTRKKRTD